MKHNHTNHRFPRSGVAPYIRHAKREYAWSEPLTRWIATTRAGNASAATVAARDHGRFLARQRGIVASGNFFEETAP